MSTGVDARFTVTRAGFDLDIHIGVEEGKTMALMGPSGAGKSTILGVIAGVNRPGSGEIILHDRVVDRTTRPRKHVRISRRGVILLGQNPRLFPHLNVRDNVAFAQRAARRSAKFARTDADEWLWRVGLPGSGDHKVHELSGGQQQRVAVARALAAQPAALLLDEPLNSLDPESAGGIRAMLRDQLSRTRTTAIIATHQAIDALALADTIAVVEHGRLTQFGDVRGVFTAPATSFVATLAGMNRIEGQLRSGVFVQGDIALTARSGARRFANAPDGTPVAAVFAPGDVKVEAAGAATLTQAIRLHPEHAPGSWMAEVQRLEQTPAGVRVRTTHCAADISVERAAELDLTAGSPVRFVVDPRYVRLIAL